MTWPFLTEKHLSTPTQLDAKKERERGASLFEVNAIEVEGLRKSYENFEAVRGIDFTVPTGSVFAFLGPNGAGKTTTVEILEGYRQRSSGNVNVLGYDPAVGGRALRNRIGIVLQECGFPRYATVKELLDLQSSYYPTSKSVGEVIELVGLDEKATSIVKTLSGGQQRRLDLALALVGNPDLIFLDEPTTGFDPNARRSSWDVISNLRTLGKTVFLTTHYMDEAQYLADHVAIISGGEIVASGSPESLGGRDLAETQIRFAKPALFDVNVDVNGFTTETVEQDEESIVIKTKHAAKTLYLLTGWALENNVELNNLSVSRPTLEDIYLQLTAEHAAVSEKESVNL